MFLQILGVTFLVILAIIVATVLYFRVKLGGDLFKSLFEDNEFPPLAVTLIEDISPDWTDEVASTANALQAHGFTAGKAYRIHEMNETFLWHFYREHTFAIILKYPVIGDFVEFYAKENEEKAYFATNSTFGDEASAPPQFERHLFPDHDVDELFDAFEQIIEGKTLAPLAPTSFSDFYEHRYKIEVAHQNQHGGLSHDTFEEMLETLPVKLKVSSVEKLYLKIKIKEFDNWIQPAINEFYELSGIEPSEDDDFVIVPKEAYLPAFLTYLADENIILPDVEKYQEKYADEADNYAVFEKINNLFSPSARCVHIATQQYPLPLKIYRRQK